MARGSHFIYLHLPMLDAESEVLAPFLPAAFAFFDEARLLRTRCLVHCIAGVSRSPSVLIAYLVREGMTLDAAMRLVLRKRPLVCPNNAFRHQLALFELNLRGHSTVARSSHPVWNFPSWNLVKRTVPVAPG